jgi:hypothetical protein
MLTRCEAGVTTTQPWEADTCPAQREKRLASVTITAPIHIDR